MENPKRILIVRTDRLGDMVLSTPVIENLRNCFPDSYIAFLCRPYTRQVLEGNPYLDEVIVYDKYGRHKDIFASMKFALGLKKKKFDWAVILHPTNRVHLLTFMAGIKFRVGWDKKMGFLLSKKLRHLKDKGEKHETEYTLDILRQIDIPIKSKNLFVFVYSGAEEWTDNYFRQQGVRSDNYKVALGIGSSCPSKIWPTDNFIKVGKRIKKQIPAEIFILGEDKEKKLLASVRKKDRAIGYNLLGALDVPKLISFFKRIDLLVVNDCGLVHLCAAVGTPVIAIFGRAQEGLAPRRWKPLGKNSFYLHKNVGCKECLAHNCKKGFLCLKAIKPEEVVELSKRILRVSKH